MDSNTLLNIATQFLQTPQGTKLIESIADIDPKLITDAIAEADKVDKEEKEELNAEERKRERQRRRREKLDEKRTQAGNKIAQYLPYIASFTTKGRIYDKQTKEPIQGIDVYPQLCLFPVINTQRENPVTKDPLFDDNNKPLFRAIKDENLASPRNSKVQNINGKYGVKTDENGEFEITVGLPVIDAIPNVVLSDVKAKPFVVYQDNNQGSQTDTQREEGEGAEYAPSIQIIVQQNGEVPQEQNLHGILNITTASEYAAEEAKNEIVRFALEKATPILNFPEQFLIKLRNAVLKPSTVVQNRLLPLAFQLMLYFGIAKQEQANQLQRQCPSNDRLKDILAKRNSVVRQINNMYGIIIANTALAVLFAFLSPVFKGISNQVANIPIPLQFAAYPVTSRLDRISALLDQLSDVNKELKKQLIIALIFLIISLIIILRYLKTIDLLIESCEDVGAMEEINAELLVLQGQSEAQGNSTLQNVNGFSLSVEVVDKAQVGELPRRQAVAKDSRGIIVLRGEPSFSAEDQILLDELAFYIQINNLKAN